MLKNFEFEHEGNKYWYSRSIACSVILQSFKDNIRRILVVQRGPNSTYPGKWFIPGGFLEHDETLYECALRELHEETGIDIGGNSGEDIFTKMHVIDEPELSSMQTVTFVFSITRGDAYDLPTTNLFSEPGEIADIQWVTPEEFKKLDLAFNPKYIDRIKSLI